MPDRPFDTTLKEMIEGDALGWAGRFNPRPVTQAAFVDADVSTVSASSDKVLRVVDDRGTRLLVFEPLSYHDAGAPRRVHLYSTVLHTRHELPVRAVIVLLRPEANARAITGLFEITEPGETEPYERFRYQVVRVWELPVEPLLTASFGLLPLAALTDEAMQNPEPVVKRINERLKAEAQTDLAGKLLTATFLLMGMRYDAQVAAQLYRGVTQMEESTTYQLILSRGETKGKRDILLRQGRLKFGEPNEAQLREVEGIGDIDQLERLLDRILTAPSWEALLESP